jgi:hypothetical protein
VGTVTAVLRHDGHVYVAFGTGHAPRSGFVAVPWERVAGVDPAQAAVKLDLRADALDEEALALPARNAVEGAGAEAVRLTDPPPEIVGYASPAEPGPQDRPVVVFLPFVAVAGAVGGIGAAGLFAAGATTAGIVVAVVAALLLAWSAFILVRAGRSPYVRRRAPRGPKPTAPSR